MIPQSLRSRQPRAGMAIHLILALLLSMAIITLTYAIGSSRATTQATLLTLLKADYQLESATIMNFIRLQNELSRGQVSTSHWDPKREISPGVYLRSGFKKVGPNQFRIIAFLTGQSINKRFFAQATWREPASPSAAAIAPDSPPVTPLATPSEAVGSGMFPSVTPLATPSEDFGSGTPALTLTASEAVGATATAAIPSIMPASGSWVIEYLPDQGDRDQ